MSAFETEYDVFALVANTGRHPLYHWKAWQFAAGLLHPVVTAARAKTAIWATYSWSGGYGRYGKFGWNDRGHQKWPVGAPLVRPEAKNETFSSYELWNPSWPTSEREGVGPDVYLKLWNAVSQGHKIIGFEYGFLFAVSKNLPKRLRQPVPDIMRRIGASIDTTIIVATRRPWAISPGDTLSPKPPPSAPKPRPPKKPENDTRIDFYLSSLAHSFWQHNRTKEPIALSHFGKGWETLE